MKTNVKIIVSAAVALLAGYFIGALAGFPSVDSNSGKGDISKVSKFRMTTVSPQMNALQEKIMNDPQELKKAAISLTCLTARMTEFAGLVDIAVDAASGKSGLEKSLASLQSMKNLSENAAQAGQDVLTVFDQMTSGKGAKNASAYEQASQNLSIAYLMVDRQLKVAKDFVAEVDAYLDGKSLEDNGKLALARDLWVDYCAGNAILNGDKSSLAYWNNQGNVLSSEQFTGALRSSEFASPAFLSAVSVDAGIISLQSINSPAADVLSSTVLAQLSNVGSLCEGGLGFLPEMMSNGGLSNSVAPVAESLQMLGSLPADQLILASTAVELASLGSSSTEMSQLGSSAELTQLGSANQLEQLGSSDQISQLSNAAEQAVKLGNVSPEMASLAASAVALSQLGSSSVDLAKFGLNSDEMAKLGQSMLEIAQLGSTSTSSALKASEGAESSLRLSPEGMAQLGMVAISIQSLNFSADQLSVLSNIAAELSSIGSVATDLQSLKAVVDVTSITTLGARL